MSLSKKIFVAISATILIVSILSAVVIYRLNSIQAQRSIGQAQLDIAKATIDSIDLLLSERYGDVQAFSRLAEVESYLQTTKHSTSSTEDLDSRLSQFRLIYGTWQTILVVDPSGKVVASTDKDLEGKMITATFKESDLLQKAQQGTVTYSDFFNSSFIGDPTVAFASPVYAVPGSKEISGVVLGYVDWNVIKDIIASTGYESHLLNAEGISIATVDKRGIDTHADYSSYPAYLNAKQGESGSEQLQDPETGDHVLASYIFESGYLNYLGNQWILILERESLEAFSEARQDSLILAGFLTIAGVVMAILGVLLVKRVVFVPIEHLANVARRIAAGDLKLKAAVENKDEIGELAEAFNEMTERLQDMNANLDANVKAKTAELSQKLDELSKMNKLMVDRELKMVELKRRIAELEARSE